jgi:hypothetical protein
MAQWPFRFVHASDLHLEQPPGGVAEIPEALRELFIEAPYAAAEQIVDTALAEEVEFVVLSGDVLQAQQTGPRGPLFWAAQCERLRERGISVYWASGRVDSQERWPSSVALPDNVYRFPAGELAEFTPTREGVPLARILGVSRARGKAIRIADFRPDPGGLYSIAVIHGNADAAVLKSRGMNYWALGGSHARTTLFSEPGIAHYPGSPQGRLPVQAGPHGCTLVHVDQERRGKITFVPTDLLRWQNERILVDDQTSRKDLESKLFDRMRALRETMPGVDLMVHWTVAGSGKVVSQLRRGALGRELLERLRAEFGKESPVAWSFAIEVEPGDALPTEWYEQQTMCGDFLREIRRYQMNPELAVAMEGYLVESQRELLGAAATIVDEAERQRVLREAALLGADLLSGEELEP